MERETGREREKRLNIAAKLAVVAIKCYRILISSWTPPRCRFYPTCSQYMIQALETHGFLKGSYLGIKRILRCHPANEGGYDPVPER
ncbi:MAG: membrane protein insertion efficiency factor YidD [Actinomycetota bacterium]